MDLIICSYTVLNVKIVVFRSEKKPSFECFLERCNLKFWNANDRKQHSINEHLFPADFKFDTTEKSVGNKSSKKKTSKPSKSNGGVEKMDDDSTKVEPQKEKQKKSR